ncbi:unnamed protein product [Larinioides sclopetarius]|uniref:Uncharacterized protein n=1 Tax=Larinioides sclopetarius TaxID=280406 RepID=A0AAV1ZRU1_9ARAC
MPERCHIVENVTLSIQGCAVRIWVPDKIRHYPPPPSMVLKFGKEGVSVCAIR